MNEVNASVHLQHVNRHGASPALPTLFQPFPPSHVGVTVFLVPTQRMMIMRTTQQATDRMMMDVRTVSTTAILNAMSQLKAVIRALRHRSLAQSLAELDDYLLNDIGLTRAELEGELLKEKYLSDPTIKLAEYAGVRVKKQVPRLSLG
ncbi:MAG TPA: hypothetical protein DDW73_02575 [Rhizobium sp.]|jgi:uncharacterized protein YjiS (DUF1127 family)|nr:hypothetical protein [Rhizobium sp.]